MTLQNKEQLNLAKQYHGPSFDELFRLYHQSVQDYTEYSFSFDKETYTELDEMELTRLYYKKDQAENDLFAFIKK
jgi:hypothetical protein